MVKSESVLISTCMQSDTFSIYVLVHIIASCHFVVAPMVLGFHLKRTYINTLSRRCHEITAYGMYTEQLQLWIMRHLIAEYF